jgi:hypothetical protein
MNSNITDDDLNRTLIESGEIVPSSGFVASVMEAVQQEATVPAPIPFPWKQAIPGLIASAALIVYFLVSLGHAGTRAGFTVVTKLPFDNLQSLLPQALAGDAIRLSVEWSVMALLVSFVAVRLSMRIGRE